MKDLTLAIKVYHSLRKQKSRQVRLAKIFNRLNVKQRL